LIPWESQLERDAMLVLEFDPKVAWFREHQEHVFIDTWPDDFSAYPDLVTFLGSSESAIVEVKADAALRDPALRARLNRVEAHFESQGVGYRILAEAEIRQQPRLKNLETLITYRRPLARMHLTREPQVQRLLNWPHSTTLDSVTRFLGGPARAFQLIANGFLETDLAQPLLPGSRLSIAKGALT
jgi:hypothetical protein